MTTLYWLVIPTFLVATVGTGLVVRYSLRKRIMDFPNPRSSHTYPTPRGGGLAIVVSFQLAVIAIFVLGGLSFQEFAAISGGLFIAAIGFVDDIRNVGAQWRLLVHIAAGIWAIGWLGGMPPLQLGTSLIDLGFAGDILAILLIVWVLNLFNFMDGIDGIAGMEGAFVALAAVLLAHGSELSDGLRVSLICLGVSSIGFLLWNWPAAKIFMGDVGSGFLGFVLCVLMLATSQGKGISLWTWLILFGLFLVDATVTLMRRMIQREKWYSAHRSHAYQWLARQWGSHTRVTLLALAINVFWLLPIAYLSIRFSDVAWWLCVLALGALVPLALLAGAGRKEQGA